VKKWYRHFKKKILASLLEIREAKKVSEKQSTRIQEKSLQKRVDSLYSETKRPNLDKCLIFKLRKTIGA
jgi:hypothetical protein